MRNLCRENLLIKSQGKAILTSFTINKFHESVACLFLAADFSLSREILITANGMNNVVPFFISTFCAIKLFSLGNFTRTEINHQLTALIEIRLNVSLFLNSTICFKRSQSTKQREIFSCFTLFFCFETAAQSREERCEGEKQQQS